jgi:hypothetical protein
MLFADTHSRDFTSSSPLVLNLPSKKTAPPCVDYGSVSIITPGVSLKLERRVAHSTGNHYE